MEQEPSLPSSIAITPRFGGRWTLVQHLRQPSPGSGDMGTAPRETCPICPMQHTYRGRIFAPRRGCAARGGHGGGAEGYGLLPPQWDLLHPVLPGRVGVDTVRGRGVLGGEGKQLAAEQVAAQGHPQPRQVGGLNKGQAGCPDPGVQLRGPTDSGVSPKPSHIAHHCVEQPVSP